MAAVCVYCSSAEPIEAHFLELATAVGAGLAARGYSLVSGGGRVSMMGAVARAARAGGAHTQGVIPKHLMPREVADTDADSLVVVDTMRERKQVMDDASDAFLALPGGLGTLEELFEVWTAASLGMHTKPVIVLDDGSFYQPLWSYLDSLVARGFVQQRALDALVRVSRVDDAFAAIERAVPPGTGPAARR